MSNLRSLIIQETKTNAVMNEVGKRYGIGPSRLADTLVKSCFSSTPNITPAQLLGVMVVAQQYNLNPFIKELYAFPAKGGGIVPIVSVDGWYRIMNEHPQFDGIQFEWAESMTEMGTHVAPSWCEAIIHRKDRTHATRAREFFAENYMPKKGGHDGPWQTRPSRMLRHRAAVQAARMAFSFAGFYDPDEGEHISTPEVVATDGTQAANKAIDETLTGESREVPATFPEPTEQPITEVDPEPSSTLSPEDKAEFLAGLDKETDTD